MRILGFRFNKILFAFTAINWTLTIGFTQHSVTVNKPIRSCVIKKTSCFLVWFFFWSPNVWWPKNHIRPGVALTLLLYLAGHGSHAYAQFSLYIYLSHSRESCIVDAFKQTPRLEPTICSPYKCLIRAEIKPVIRNATFNCSANKAEHQTCR